MIFSYLIHRVIRHWRRRIGAMNWSSQCCVYVYTVCLCCYRVRIPMLTLNRKHSRAFRAQAFHLVGRGLTFCSCKLVVKLSPGQFRSKEMTFGYFFSQQLHARQRISSKGKSVWAVVFWTSLFQTCTSLISFILPFVLMIFLCCWLEVYNRLWTYCTSVGHLYRVFTFLCTLCQHLLWRVSTS